MRNYQLMRNILKKVKHSQKPLTFLDFKEYGEPVDVKDELIRLKDEGLIEHDMAWSYDVFDGGEVSSITDAGLAFFRNIENDNVWFIVKKTLDDADLDLSYPLLKEVCDEIVKRYVMGKIPKDL